MPKYCTYWLESMWSGAKYTAVNGMPSPSDLLDPLGELDAAPARARRRSAVRSCWTLAIIVSKSTP